MRSFCAMFAPVAVVAALAVPAQALLVQQVEPDGSLAEAVIEVVDHGDHIQVGLVKEFKDASMIGSPLVLQFILEDADAGKDISLYRIIDPGTPDELQVGELALNSTGVDWWDYHILLVNVPPITAPFLPPFADAAFVAPAGVVSDVFGAPVVATADRLEFAGGPVLSGFGTYISGIVISHNGVPDGMFYLKQIPTPEPAALSLLIGGTMILLRRRRR